MQKRLYSSLTIKNFNEDERLIEGVATTPTTDRMGDIVESEGAQYSLPIPLLWQHDSSQPVGHVEACQVTKDGIAITARMVQVTEPGTLKDRLDEAWQSIKSGLVRGLSIGFVPIESNRIKDTWNEHFLKWDWLELSCVTIPANVEASIVSIKSADQAMFAASGNPQLLETVPLKPPATGDTGAKQPAIPTKGIKMKMTIAEQIALIEATRVETTARMSELMSGEVNAEARAEFDALQLKCAELDGDVLRVKALETIQLATATPVTEVVNTDPLVATDVRAGNSGIISVRQNLAEGIPMARWAMALVRARGNLSEALAATQHNRIWMDTSPQLALTLKAAVAAGDTTTAGWASELVYVNNLSSEFIEFLRPATILGKLPGLTRVPFNMRVAGQNAGSSSHWVGQGQPVTVSKLGTTSVLLGMAKAAGLVAIDEELVRSSSPTAELMVRNDLAKAIAQFLDEQFLDPSLSEVINVSPASVLHGVTPITPSGTDFVAFRADIHTMLDRFVEAKLDTTANVFIMTPSMALSISMMLNALGQQLYPNIMASGGTLLGVPVVTSMSSHFSDEDVGSVISLVNAPEILLADDGQVTITASTEASIQMVDNPSNQSTGETTATSLVSMFQTSSMAIKAVRYINWGKRRSSAAAWIKTAAYK